MGWVVLVVVVLCLAVIGVVGWHLFKPLPKAQRELTKAAIKYMKQPVATPPVRSAGSQIKPPKGGAGGSRPSAVMARPGYPGVSVIASIDPVTGEHVTRWRGSDGTVQERREPSRNWNVTDWGDGRGPLDVEEGFTVMGGQDDG